jgi:hypothetical protein
MQVVRTNLIPAALVAVACSAMPAGALAQPAASSSSPLTTAAIASDADRQRPSPMATPAPKSTQKAPAVKAHRWFDLQTGQVDARYRLIETSADVRTSNMLQHKQTIRAAFKFDPKGRYTLQIGLGSGSSFTGSWEATGVGTGEPTWAFAVRTLSVAAQPITGVDIQVGGLAATLRGESTEITAYDNDGFLVGERVSVKRPKDLYFDELSATIGYLGDVTTPNVFKRLDALDRHNYTQLLAAKKLGARAAVSGDWTRVAGVETWREAVRVVTNETGVIDGVRLELYQRVDDPDGEGFALTLDRAVTKTLSLSGGYASIDRSNPTLNGDRFLRGNRVFVEGRVNLTPELTVSSFYSRAINNDFAIANKTRFDIVVSYNVLRALQRAGAW